LNKEKMSQPGFVMFNVIFKMIFTGVVMIGGSVPLALSGPVQARELVAGAPVAPPLGFLRYCLLNPAACRPTDATVEQVALTQWRWSELQAVQNNVNRRIQPRPDSVFAGIGGDDWRAPTRGAGAGGAGAGGAGDCEDYALAKRQALLRRGWPDRALRLATAHTAAKEPHVVLVVSTSRGDLVLDNRLRGIQHWQALNYTWLAVQNRSNPLRWHVAETGTPPIQQSVLASVQGRTK
jgi:predicted transglutaminase-like cysteine proteinase